MKNKKTKRIINLLADTFYISQILAVGIYNQRVAFLKRIFIALQGLEERIKFIHQTILNSL